MDGSSNSSASGASLLLTALEGIKIEHAIWLGFRATNNKAEYEALIAGLNAVKEARANRITIYINSKLVEG